jgi:hypothetical protein
MGSSKEFSGTRVKAMPTRKIFLSINKGFMHYFQNSDQRIGNNELPVLLGELGSFSENPVNFNLINKAIHEYAAEDKNSSVISTKDLKDKGDHLHFDSKGQRNDGE